MVSASMGVLGLCEGFANLHEACNRWSSHRFSDKLPRVVQCPSMFSMWRCPVLCPGAGRRGAATWDKEVVLPGLWSDEVHCDRPQPVYQCVSETELPAIEYTHGLWEPRGGNSCGLQGVHCFSTPMGAGPVAGSDASDRIMLATD
jgi:hypothetical protein